MTQLPIPDDWTPEQALAVYDFVDALREAIWTRYQIQLINLMREDRVSVFEVGDDITF